MATEFFQNSFEILTKKFEEFKYKKVVLNSNMQLKWTTKIYFCKYPTCTRILYNNMCYRVNYLFDYAQYIIIEAKQYVIKS